MYSKIMDYIGPEHVTVGRRIKIYTVTRLDKPETWLSVRPVEPNTDSRDPYQVVDDGGHWYILPYGFTCTSTIRPNGYARHQVTNKSGKKISMCSDAFPLQLEREDAT